MKFSYLFFLSLLFLFLFLPYVSSSSSSMGISPASDKIVYTGEGIVEGKFTLFPVEEKNVKVQVVGDLEKYILLNGNNPEISMHLKGPVVIQYSIELPANLKPGEYTTKIRCIQDITPEEKIHSGTATATAAVAYIVKVRVPNEGKFLEAVITTEPAKINLGDVVYFDINILNFGTEDLTNLQTDLIIKDQDGITISKKQTTSVDILRPAEKGDLRAFWDTQGQKPGIYHAQASIFYGGKLPTDVSTDLKLGDINIQIINISTILNESIAKIFIDVQSNWNEVIQNVYAEVVIKNGSQQIDKIKTSSVDLAAWSKDRLTAFWERGALNEGEYKLEIYVYYYDKQENKQTLVNLPSLEKPAPITSTNNMALIIIAIALLVLILLANIAWFIFSSRKKNVAEKKLKEIPKKQK